MFWQKFSMLCADIKKSPSAVAREIGFSNAAAAHWKKGKFPSGASLQKIADYFNIPVDFLLSTPAGSSIAASDRGKGVRIPVYGSVAAGIPIEAITDIEDYEEIPEDMAAGGTYVALRIQGNSMSPMIQQGDIVIVRVQETAETGDIAVVFVNGEDATCKKIKKTPEGLLLISLNAEYEPMFYSRSQMADTPIRIFGKVVEMRRTLQ